METWLSTYFTNVEPHRVGSRHACVAACHARFSHGEVELYAMAHFANNVRSTGMMFISLDKDRSDEAAWIADRVASAGVARRAYWGRTRPDASLLGRLRIVGS
jgi:hypothetical protein